MIIFCTCFGIENELHFIGIEKNDLHGKGWTQGNNTLHKSVTIFVGNFKHICPFKSTFCWALQSKFSIHNIYNMHAPPLKWFVGSLKNLWSPKFRPSQGLLLSSSSLLVGMLFHFLNCLFLLWIIISCCFYASNIVLMPLNIKTS